MTDGAHVVPVPTESEMAHIRGIFSRAADAIVAASELGQRVAELASQVQALRMEVERVRESNRWLEQQLFDTARARDEARREATEASEALVIARETIHKHETEIEGAKATISAHTDTITRLHRESDEHLERALSAENELAFVKSKLDEAMGWIEEIHDRFKPKPPVSEVTPEPFHPEPSQPPQPPVVVEPLSAASEAGDTKSWPSMVEEGQVEERKEAGAGFKW